MTETPQTPLNPAASPANSAGSPTVNPFSGVGPADFAREGAGVLFLLLSLALPWSYIPGSYSFIWYGAFSWRPASYGLAAGNIAVVLLVLLAVLAVAVTYLARAGVLPATWNFRMLWAIRAGLTVPYVLLVFVTLFINTASGSGLGVSAALGVAGALLLASPRAHELIDERARASAARIARVTVVVFGAVFVLMTLASLLQLQLAVIGQRIAPLDIAGGLLTFIAVAALLGLLLTGLLRRREPSRLLLGTVGVVAVAYCILVLVGAPLQSIMFASDSGFAVLFAAAAGALALSPFVAAAMARREGSRDWSMVAAHGLGLLAIAAAVIVVRSVLSVIEYGFPVVGVAITLILASAVVAVGAVIARNSFLDHPAAARPLVLIVAGGAVLLGLIETLVLAFSQQLNTDYLLLLTAFGLPITIAVAVTLPASVRAGLPGALRAARPAPGAPAQPTVAEPVEAPSTIEANPSTSSGATVAETAVAEPVEAPSTIEANPSTGSGAAPAHGFTVAQAADPATDAATLFRIVQEAPDLRPQVASNPSTYPDLIDWLAGLGDPAVTAALEKRSEGA